MELSTENVYICLNNKTKTMKKQEILEQLIKDAEWSIRYHSDKMLNEAKNVSPREFEMDYHRRKLEESAVLLEQLKK